MGQRVGPVLPIRIEGQMRRVCDETGYVVSLNIHRHTQTHKVHVANRGGEGGVMWARSTFLDAYNYILRDWSLITVRGGGYKTRGGM